jgi:hypothetical protein
MIALKMLNEKISPTTAHKNLFHFILCVRDEQESQKSIKLRYIFFIISSSHSAKVNLKKMNGK